MTAKYWKRICAIPAYMFLLSPSGSRVQKMEGGNWIDQHEAQKVVDAAEEELSGLIAERDQLKAENEALRKDKDRLDALEANFWDVRHNSSAMADSGDYNTSVEIVGHWMEKPCERVIGEDYNENLRAAIDQAIKAPAYPPARPDYEFDIPDFGGGSGNKARRKAEALGIDYDAAMGKAVQP